MSGFSIDWLNLREVADRRARDAGLLERARRWLNAADSRGILVDLGAGTGATLRAFATAADVDTENDAPIWRLVDHDADLLAEAWRRHGDTCRLARYTRNLTAVANLPLEGARLVTASALFDLVSAEFIDTLARALHDRSRHQPIGLYAALNYDGSTTWTPGHELDATVLAAFNRDQRRDKGFGPALGPQAGQYLEREFSRLGFTVYAASSPWVLGETDRELAQALISGIGDAVARDPALDAASLGDWIQFRMAHALTGTCSVGHLDLLALPANTTLSSPEHGR